MTSELYGQPGSRVDSRMEVREACTIANLRPKFASDLSQGERRFVAAMDDVGFGRFENLRIARGQLILSPWPTTVRTVKLGSAAVGSPSKPSSNNFELKSQTADLFEYLRGVQVGAIRVLEVRHGNPALMEVEHQFEEAQ